MTDPIADFLIRIKNGYLARKREIVAPYSKTRLAIAQKLVAENYLEEARHKEGEIIVKLKYKDRQPAVNQIKRISKPGLRVYKKAKDWKKRETGTWLISSSQGVITNKEAVKKNLGGEVIGYID